MALTGVLPAVHGCWVAESPATGVLLTGGRYTHVDGAVVGLQVHEDHVEQYAQQLYEALRERVIELKGYTPEELEPMLDKQCAGAARERRDSALQLLDRSDEFLLHQVLFPSRPCGAQRAPFLPVFTVCCEAFCCDMLGDEPSMIFQGSAHTLFSQRGSIAPVYTGSLSTINVCFRRYVGTCKHAFRM